MKSAEEWSAYVERRLAFWLAESLQPSGAYNSYITRRYLKRYVRRLNEINDKEGTNAADNRN